MTREEAIEYLNTLYMAFAVFPNQQISLGDVDKMKESVSMAIKALEQNERAEEWYKLFVEKLEQEPKTGHWIEQDVHNCHTTFECSECGYRHSFMHLYGYPTADYTYCPNCGAKMEEGSEDYICDTCKHNDKEWDEEPCDGCCGNHSGYEPSGETVSLEAFKQVMWERDIAIEQLHELGYELGQKIEPSGDGDVVSRQAILEQTYLWSKDEFLRVTNPFDYLRKRINSLPSINSQEPKSPCDLCRYNPPSSADGKPCTMCPATTIEPQESEE